MAIIRWDLFKTSKKTYRASYAASLATKPYPSRRSAIAEFTANDAAAPVGKDNIQQDAAEDKMDGGNVRTKRNRLSGGGGNSNFAALQAGGAVQLPRGCKFKAKTKARLKAAKDDDLGVDKECDNETPLFKLSRQKRASFLQSLFFGGGGGGGEKAEKQPQRPSRPSKRPSRPPYAPSPLARLPPSRTRAKTLAETLARTKSYSGPVGLALEMQLLSQAGSLEQRYRNAPPKAKRQSSSSTLPRKMQKFSQLMAMRKAIAGGLKADKARRARARPGFTRNHCTIFMVVYYGDHFTLTWVEF